MACTGPAGQPSAKASPSQPKLSSGGVVEYPIPNPPPYGESSPGDMVAGQDGNLWFVEHIVSLRLGTNRDVVGRMTPSGAITEFEVPNQLGLLGITAGPDGNIWMTANRGGQGSPDWILRISRTGDVTKFHAGTNAGGGFGTGPEGITAGPDGNIWFTEFWTGRIGRMTPAGVLTEFKIPTPDSNPRGITAGPDGNLWFTESSLNRPAIARIRPTGEIVEYPLFGGSMDNQLNPTAVVAGPDGNVWFTEKGNIGRITPAGVITVFPLAGAGSPGGLVEGPDRNLWFTDWGANSVGRISPEGTIREFALPRRRSGLSGIAAGPDGRIWFAETDVSRIASIGVTVPEVTFGAKVGSFGTKSALSTRTVAITNTGDAGLSIASALILGPDQDAFTKTRDDCTGRTIAVNATCQVEVAFTPGSYAGLRAARLELTDNATASPQAVSLIAQLPTCTLPVFESSPSQPGTYQPPPAPNKVSLGGFLSLASGALVDDPKGGFTSDAYRSSSQTSPVLYGHVPASYDRPAGRWVPAPIEVISPDGTRYAYVDYEEMPRLHMHVVDVATGTGRPGRDVRDEHGALGCFH
ncbi:MAG TPA: hypothetical protein VGU71_14855 [Candidatus Dormibacteraeota bacterium]|nr:hypothetical protein [Candidatus Dormibacteraeota bacterium]